MCVLILSISFVQQAYWLYTSSSSLYDWIYYCPVQYVPYEVKVDIVELCVLQPWPWLLKILVCSITLEEVGLIRCLSNVSFCLYIYTHQNDDLCTYKLECTNYRYMYCIQLITEMLLHPVDYINPAVLYIYILYVWVKGHLIIT